MRAAPRHAAVITTGLAIIGSLTTVTVADSVVRVSPSTARELRVVLEAATDTWSHGVGPGPIDVVVDERGRAMLDALDIPYCVMIEDLEALVEDERVRLSQQDGGLAGTNFFADFRPIEVIHARLAEMAQGSGGIATEVLVGHTLEGREIRGLQIAVAAPGVERPALFINGCQHAREWATPPTCLWIAERLITGWQSGDPAISDVLATFDVYVVPVVNADGYVHTWGPERLWRKNRRNNGDGTFGIDLNRNWGFMWGGPGSSGTTSSETYRGPSPWSEPETQAMRDFILARPEIVAAIDFHSYSQLILWPYGFTAAQVPANASVYQASTNAMEQAIEATHGTPYTTGPIAPTLYVADGSSVDWIHEQGSAAAWTIEVRDTGSYGFVMPPSEIVPNAEENFDAFLAMGTWFAHHPVFVELPNPLPTAIAPSTPHPLTATVFTQFGTMNVAPELRYSWGGAPEQSVPAISGDGVHWTASLPPFPCGSEVAWRFAASAAGVTVFAPAAGVITTPILSETVVAENNAEQPDGWTAGAVGDTATAGLWARAEPQGTAAQPGADHSDPGTSCWVTGPLAGSSLGTHDVDGGVTTLATSAFDGRDGASVSFWMWYSNNRGSAPASDTFPIEISGDDGATWQPLETIPANGSTNAWVFKSYEIASIASPTAAMRLRFRAQDLGSGSIVEAAIDDFQVSISGCPSSEGDLNGDGSVNGADLALLLGAWGNSAAGDLDGNGSTDGADLALLLGAWTL
ncbi:MAG: M14 family zinc carboxypeptidase [Planctomycetota bacterium]|nr:M14 family zinc carboxypeptidase [Planctomycetota bacterium]MDA1105470.1 M14 family zinc carboxypeptidase [Planctomycetota bacterium]